MTCSRLLVVRHGRTEEDRSRSDGRGDVPLDAVGAAQARTIAAVLGREPLDRILCSPLRRALDTAAPLARAAGLVPRVHAALGDPEPGAAQRPGEDGVAQAWHRLAVLRESLGLDGVPGTTVVVGLSLTNRLLVGMLVGDEPSEALRSPLYRPAPGSVAELSRDAAGWRMHAFRITALSAAL